MTKYINNNFENLLKDKIKNEYQNFDKNRYDFDMYKTNLEEVMISIQNMIEKQFNNHIKVDEIKQFNNHIKVDEIKKLKDYLDEIKELKDYFINLKQDDIDVILSKLYDEKILQEGGGENRDTIRRDMRLILSEEQTKRIRNNYNYKTDIISILFLIFGFFMLYIAYYTLTQLPNSIEQIGLTGLNDLIIRIQDEIVNTKILTLKGFVDIICGFRLEGNTTLQTFVGNIQQIVLDYFIELGSNTLEDVTQQLSQQCSVGISHNSMFETIFNTMTSFISPSIKTNCITHGLILNGNMLMIHYGMILNKLTTEMTSIISLINFGVSTITGSTCYLIYRIRNRRPNRIDTHRQLRLEGGYKKSKTNKKYNKRYDKRRIKNTNKKYNKKSNNQRYNIII